jgi:hypothetical protein
MKFLTTFTVIFAIFALLSFSLSLSLSFSLSSIKNLGVSHFKFHIQKIGHILGYLILLSIFIDFLYLAYNFYNNWSDLIANPHFIPNGESNNNLPMDPLRWYPGGVPQGMGVVGGGLATYTVLSRMGNVSPRIRVLASLGAMGVSTAHIVYNSALEHSVGFNRLAWGYRRWQQDGTWPSIDEVAKNKTPQELDNFANDLANKADPQLVSKIVEEVKNSTNKFLPSLESYKDLIDTIIDKIFKETMQFFQPVPVQGFLDDLIGQRMFIEVILFITCILTVVLIIAFIFNLIFLLNKDKFIKFFDNKIFTLYLKYQAFLAKITIFYLPIFIALGLFTMCHGLHWLITNQIPYNSLDIELHQFISSKDSILGIILSSKTQSPLSKYTMHSSLSKSSQRKLSSRAKPSNLSKSNLPLSSIS